MLLLRFELVNIQYPVPLRAARALGKEIVESHHEAEAAKALKSAPAAQTLWRQHHSAVCRRDYGARTAIDRGGISATEVHLVGQAPGNAIAAQANKSKLDLLALFGAAPLFPRDLMLSVLAGMLILPVISIERRLRSGTQATRLQLDAYQE